MMYSIYQLLYGMLYIFRQLQCPERLCHVALILTHVLTQIILISCYGCVVLWIAVSRVLKQIILISCYDCVVLWTVYYACPPPIRLENRITTPKHMEITCIRTCLLYTYPSPRDRQKSRMPSSA